MHRPQSTRTFSSFVREDWLPVVLPTVKYATQKNYCYFLDVHLLPTFGAQRPCEIERETVQLFLASKLGDGLAWKTVKEMRGVLGRVLGSAELWEYITLTRHNLLRRQLRPACKELGLYGITWHSLRHSHATLLDAMGAPLGTVQALLGHSTSEITREVYLHAIPEDQRRAVAGVESLVFGFNRTQTDSTSSSAQNSAVVSN